MNSTRYFDEQVRSRRPYVTVELCETALANVVKRTVQADGRIRVWGSVTLPNEQSPRILRVILLADGQTIHNAFLDRGYREDVP